MTSPGDSVRLLLPGGRMLVIAGPGDITKETTDAIVNAANSSLMGGGGVDGAIHRAGGPAILKACEVIVSKQGRLPAGRAVATPGGNLPARYVIHTVGPVWSGGGENEPETLASCHLESIRVADQLKLRSLAFPAISTGIYGYPVGLAASVAITTTAEALLKAAHLREVRFVLFDRYALEHFQHVARTYAAGKSIELDSYHAP
jgi:O-acetyl-ADP-ribose deacetylase (regulator of RNase III)